MPTESFSEWITKIDWLWEKVRLVGASKEIDEVVTGYSWSLEIHMDKSHCYAIYCGNKYSLLQLITEFPLRQPAFNDIYEKILVRVLASDLTSDIYSVLQRRMPGFVEEAIEKRKELIKQEECKEVLESILEIETAGFRKLICRMPSRLKSIKVNLVFSGKDVDFSYSNSTHNRYQIIMDSIFIDESDVHLSGDDLSEGLDFLQNIQEFFTFITETVKKMQLTFPD